MTPVEQSERKGLVERIPELRRLALAVHDPNEWASDTSHIELNAADRAYISALDPPTLLALLDLLSSDARPAPMADEVKAALVSIYKHIHDGATLYYAGQTVQLLDNVLKISAHIDDLTQKVAEAEAANERDRSALAESITRLKKVMDSYGHLSEPGRGSYAWDDQRYQQEFGAALIAIGAAIEGIKTVARDWTNCPHDPAAIKAARLSRPQETDAVLAEALHVLDMAVICMRGRDQTEHEANVIVAGRLVLAKHTDLGNWTYGKEVDAPSRAEMQTRLNSVLARPSPGPATETERKDGWWVKAEWRKVGDETLQLFICGLHYGSVWPSYLPQVSDPGHITWTAQAANGMFHKANIATIKEAQTALLASIRPKQEGV